MENIDIETIEKLLYELEQNSNLLLIDEESSPKQFIPKKGGQAPLNTKENQKRYSAVMNSYEFLSSLDLSNLRKNEKESQAQSEKVSPEINEKAPAENIFFSLDSKQDFDKKETIHFLEEELLNDEKKLEEIYKSNEKLEEEESEEEKSSVSEENAKENIDNFDKNVVQEIINIKEEDLLELQKTPAKDIKISNIPDLSEKKLPKDIDFCRFSNDYLCDFNKRTLDELIELSQKQPKFREYLKIKYDLNRESRWAWKNSPLEDPCNENNLRILCITWNMAGNKPPEEIYKLFRLEEVKHHIIAIGTQECCRSILASVLYSSKYEWEMKINEALGNEYHLVKSHTLNAMHLMVFCHYQAINYIHEVNSDSVACGVGNMIANKGGIGISFKFGNTSFAFINCHLASGQSKKKILRRNKDFFNIEKSLNNIRINQSETGLLSDCFDHCFWMGDFNYRIELTMDEFVENLNQLKIENLVKYDQFLHERLKTEKLFENFKEGLILFPPTYKLYPTKNVYNIKKKNRIPGWTDRILYKSKVPDGILEINYDSIKDLFLSDHRAVFGQFTANFSIIQKV